MSEARDLGLQALQAGDVNGAIAHLTQARDQNPTDYTTLAYLGAALGRAGRAGEAVEALQRAVEIQPSQAAAHYNLGLALEKAGRAGDAAASYQQAVTLDPNHARARDGLTRVGGAAGQPKPPADPTDPSFWNNPPAAEYTGLGAAGPGLASGQTPPPLSQPGGYAPPPG